MDNLCYNLVIDQRACQNGITNNISNTYTSLVSGTEILLSFGYKLTYVSGTPNYATIIISNNLIIPDVIFNITNGETRVFDLPCECASFRIRVLAESQPCSIATTVCCNI